MVFMSNSRGNYPLMERAPVAIFLTFISGCINAWTLINAGLFGTVQSGNVLTATLAVLFGKYQHALFALMSMIAFFLGAMLGGLLVTRCVRRHRSYSALILGIEATVMGVGAILWATGVIPTTALGAHTSCMIFSFAAGMQGTAFPKDEGKRYTTIAITAVYQGFATLFGQALAAKTTKGREYDWAWFGRLGGVIVGFAAGAALVGGLSRLVGWNSASFLGAPLAATGWLALIPAGCAAIMAISAGLENHRGRRPDPNLDPNPWVTSSN